MPLETIYIDLLQNIPNESKNIIIYVHQKLQEAGFQCFLVGGSVRDVYLNREVTDFDLTTNATPQEVIKIFPHTIPVGIEFGTVLVLHKKQKAEITTYRTGEIYKDGRHPDKLQFGSSLEEDITRRDFTINGLAYDIQKKCIYDYHQGLQDLKNKQLQTIGDPITRFTEDGLRVIRGCRFIAILELNINTTILSAMKQTIHITKQVSIERFIDEWKKTIPFKNKFVFWKLLYEIKLTSYFFRSLTDLDFKMYLDILKKVSISSLEENIAHLLEATFKEKTHLNIESFKKVFKDFYLSLKLSNQTKKNTESLFLSPFFKFTNLILKEDVSIKDFKFCLSEVKPSYIKEHIHYVASILSYRNNINYKQIFLYLKQNVFTILQNNDPIYLKDLNIKGDDLYTVGFRNQQIGSILLKLLYQVHKDTSLNTKKSLTHLAEKYYAS